MRSFLKYLILLWMLSSCGTTHSSFNKREYRRSRPIATYNGMANELEDGYLILKQNGYFKFYLKFWLFMNIKEATYIGSYSPKNDTLFLNWVDGDPKQIKPYLSSKCVVDTSVNTVWFIDEIRNKQLWSLHLTTKK